MNTEPVHTFTSHIAGRNATVKIYEDRIEWEKPRRVSVGKITAGVFTAGASLLATGVKSGEGATDMIPLRQVTGVTTKRDGLVNSKVIVMAAGNTVEFRISHAEAQQVRDTVNRLVAAL